jgi:exonuclease SbcC
MDKIKEVNKVLLEEVQKIPLLKKGLKKIERKIHRLEKRKSDLTKNFDERKKEKESLEGDYQKYSILKERLANLDDAIKKLKAEITKRKREVSRLQRMKNRLPIIEKTYNEFVKLQESIDKLKPLKNKFDKLSAHLSELNISKEGKEKELSEAQEELEKTKSEIARLEKQIPSCMEANKVEKELKEIEKKKTKFEKRKAALEADIRTAKKLIKDLRRKLNEVKGKRKCPVCLQLIKDPSQVNKHYNEEITNLLSQQVKNRKILKNVELELGEAVKKFGELNIARNNLRDRFNKRQLVARETKALRRLGKREKRIDKLIQTLNAKMEKQRAIIVSLNFDEKGYSNIEARLSELRKQKISEKYVNVKTQLERLPEATEAVITSMKELNVLNDQRKGLHGEIISFGDIEKNYERVKRSFESVQKAMEENKVKLAEENISRSSGKKQLTELLEKKTSVEDNKKKIRELEKERLLLEELRNVFKNIPENILRRLRPYIEKEGNDIITDLSDGEITALNIEEETLNVAATMLGEVRPIHYFSEGQKTRINMSLRVAISRILSKLPQTEEHAYAVMQTLFVDEGDFGSLDESGIRDAVAVIRNLTREFDRVIVISHVSAIKEIFQGRMLEVIKIGSEESVVKSFGVTPELTEEIVSAK